MGFGEYGRVLAYLAEHRQAYHEALERIDRRFLVFMLNAYQSFLFNEILSLWLRSLSVERGFLLHPLRSAYGTCELYRELPPGTLVQLRESVLPVPGYDTTLADERIRQIVAQVLESEGIRLSDLRVRQMHRIRVGGVERAAIVVPEDLAQPETGPDDLYPGRKKSTLRFFLPRGSYATMLIKRLMIA
jgi:tRNA pseudouridine13 synthase